MIKSNKKKKGNGVISKSFIKTIKHKSVRGVLLSFLAIVLIFSFVIVGYAYKLLYNTEQTIIPIVDSNEISEGMLDDLSDPNDDIDIIDSNVSGDSSGIISGGSGQIVTPIFWGNGRIKIYVDSRFPIIRVDQKDPNVENFLIFGIDARTIDQQKSRTDSLIILTLDRKNNTIKMTSIMRDVYVKIPGRTNMGKVNTAYVYGGVGLLVNTINQNFDLDIQKFAMVDMLSAENVINALGGITLNISSEEIIYANGNVSETNSLFSKISSPSPFISTYGNVLLNGRQAVAYGRIRSIGSDTERTLRQRKVLTALISQFKMAPLSRKRALLETMATSFETSVGKGELISLAIDALSLMGSVAQYRVPENSMYTTNSNVDWHMDVDFTKQIPALHQFIWGSSGSGSVTLPAEESEAPTEGPDSGSGVSGISDISEDSGSITSEISEDPVSSSDITSEISDISSDSDSGSISSDSSDITSEDPG